MKIAIIGSGITGLGAAWLLHKNHAITVFEANDYVGGHARTLQVASQRGTIAVDTGFIVFNNWNYPNLLGLFAAAGVPYHNSNMSFGVSIDDGWLEYSSNDLFAQKRNLANPVYWGMLADILRFSRSAERYIDQHPDATLGTCLDDLKMGAWFRHYYLLAMGAAIWSCPLTQMLSFPASSFVRFFKNHGLLNITRRPQWYTVTGGSAQYIARVMAPFAGHIHLQTPVKRVRSEGDGVVVTTHSDKQERFDHVILACHADEALALIDAPTAREQSVLGSFRFQPNHVVLHRDAELMPRNRKAWASWVYRSHTLEDKSPAVSLTYWMNNLQNLDPADPLFVSLNPDPLPRPETIINRHVFTHPVFDPSSLRAQENMASIQGVRRLWFGGAYQRYGFHEDGLLSAVTVVKALGGSIPWA